MKKKDEERLLTTLTRFSRRASRRHAAALAALLLCTFASPVWCGLGLGPSDPATLPPLPSLVGVEEKVRQQLEAAHARVRAAAPGDAAALGTAGQTFHAYAFHDTAAAFYRLAHAADPAEPRWGYLLGSIERLEGQLDGAKKRFEAALARLERDEGDPVAQAIRRRARLSTLAALGQLHFELGRAPDAQPYFEQLLELAPDAAVGHAGLGRVALDAKEFETAAQHLRRALALDPSATRLHYYLGMALRGLGDRAAARAALQRRGAVRASTSDPYLDEVRALASSARLHVKRGTDLFAEGLFDDARREFEAAIAADPTHAPAHGNLGSALKRLGDIPGARRALERALELDPRYALAHFNLGTILAGLGELPAAIVQYRRAVALDPGAPHVHFNLANALFRDGQAEAAIPHYDAVIRETPSDASTRFGRLLCWIRADQLAAARTQVARDLEACPSDLRLEQAAARIGATVPPLEPDRAEARARALLEARSSVDHVETYAMALAAQGRFEDAVRWQRRALEVAEAGKREDLAIPMRRVLARFEANAPAARPWELDHPVLNPGRGKGR